MILINITIYITHLYNLRGHHDHIFIFSMYVIKIQLVSLRVIYKYNRNIGLKVFELCDFYKTYFVLLIRKSGITTTIPIGTTILLFNNSLNFKVSFIQMKNKISFMTITETF